MFPNPLDVIPPFTDSSLLAPTGGVALIIWLLWQAAKHYKEGRKIDVRLAEEREKAAEARADELEQTLRNDIQSLRTQLATERAERTKNEADNDREVQVLRTRINRVSRINYELIQIVIQAGMGSKIDHLIQQAKEEDKDPA